MPTKITDLRLKEDSSTIVYPNIVTDNIPSGAVTTAKIGAGAVTSAKIDGGAVTEGKIAGGAVTPSKLATGAVTETKIANESVSSGKIMSGAVTTDKLGAESVTGAKIADEAITADKVKYINMTLRDYMFARGLSYTLQNLADLVISKIAQGFSFYWKQAGGVVQYVQSLLAGVDDDNLVYFMGVRMNYSAPSPLTDRTETTYLSFQSDAEVSQFFNGADGENLFFCGISD